MKQKFIRFPNQDIATEVLEELEILKDLDPIEEIRKNLRNELFDYENDLRIWIK